MSVTRSNRDLNELHPKLKELAEKLIEEAKKEGINLGVSETYRSPERQDYLYAQGRTRPGRIVTRVKGSDMNSYHQWRLAFDVFNNVRGNEYDYQILQKVGKIGQELGLEWGGGWSGFKDSPHFQYTFGLSIRDLKAGKKPPTYEVETEEEKQDRLYKEAVLYLQEKGLLSTVEAWYPIPTAKYFELLLANLMPALMKEVDYSYQVEILKELGIITSTEIWLNKDFRSEYMKIVIERVAEKLGLEETAEEVKEVEKYQKAVKYFEEQGILTNYEAWYPEPSSKYFDILINNMVVALVRQASYDEHILILNKIGIISSTQIWLNRDLRENYMTIVIQRIADILRSN